MKNISSVFAMFFLVLFIVVLTSCSNSIVEKKHIHDYNVKNTDIKYLVSPADYESPAIYYYSCTCGHAGNDTFNHGDTIAISQGLSFVSNGDGTCYVSGIGDCSDENVVIPFTSPSGDVVTAIGDMAFLGCTNIISLTIPNSVISINNLSFKNCTGLEIITIPESVTFIGGSAFDGCSNLKNITLPKGITYIDAFLFSNCTALESVIIPDGVTEIGLHSFSGCHSLKSITIPDSVATIANSAFGDCRSLTSVNIGSGVTVIDTCAFYFCEALTNVKIPESVTFIGSNAFANCSSLVNVTFEDPNGWWTARDKSATNGTNILSSDLSDTETAAIYLTNTFSIYYWKCN